VGVYFGQHFLHDCFQKKMFVSKKFINNNCFKTMIGSKKINHLFSSKKMIVRTFGKQRKHR